MKKFQSNQPEPTNPLNLSGSDVYLQGQKLPQVFKQEKKNLSKIRDDREKIKQVYQSQQQRRQDELEEKKYKILMDMNKKNEQQMKKEQFKR